MTEFEKLIYNKYLSISRSKQNKPYRYRKDFKNFDQDPQYYYVKKLSHFFSKFSHVDIDTFFESPYHIYEDQWFDLKYYTSQRALKVYTLYLQRTRLSPPDSDEQLFGIKKSLEYIVRFCDKEDISIDNYVDHMTNNINTCILHLKQCNVTVYTLLGFDNFSNIINKSDPDVLKFTLGDIFDSFTDFRNKFIKSSLAKKLTRRGISKIKELQSTTKPV